MPLGDIFLNAATIGRGGFPERRRNLETQLEGYAQALQQTPNPQQKQHLEMLIERATKAINSIQLQERDWQIAKRYLPANAPMPTPYTSPTELESQPTTDSDLLEAEIPTQTEVIQQPPESATVNGSSVPGVDDILQRLYGPISLPEFSPTDRPPRDFGLPPIPEERAPGRISRPVSEGLIETGLQLAASRRPNFLGALAEAGMQGMNRYRESEAQMAENARAKRNEQYDRIALDLRGEQTDLLKDEFDLNVHNAGVSNIVQGRNADTNAIHAIAQHINANKVTAVDPLDPNDIPEDEEQYLKAIGTLIENEGLQSVNTNLGLPENAPVSATVAVALEQYRTEKKREAEEQRNAAAAAIYAEFGGIE